MLKIYTNDINDNKKRSDISPSPNDITLKPYIHKQDITTSAKGGKNAIFLNNEYFGLAVELNDFSRLM